MSNFWLWGAILAPRAVCAVGRVVPLLSGWHFDDLMRDTPEPPPSAIVVYSSAWCLDAWTHFGLNGGWGLPSRTHLFLGEYDMERQRDVWWHTEGAESRMWLERRFNVSRAPAVIFVPENNQQAAYQIWDGGEVSWRDWLAERLRFDLLVTNALNVSLHGLSTTWQQGESRTVRVSPGAQLEFEADDGFRFTTVALNSGTGCASLVVSRHSSPVDVRASDAYLNARDQDTTFTHSAIVRQPPIMPDHHPVSSYQLRDMPALLKDRLWAFYRKHEASRTVERYSDRATGINQHIANTTMVSFDLDLSERDAIATKYIQPLVEAWAGRPLQFTSFYGIREYYRNHELRMHVDRVATHVFSVIVNLHQEGMDADWTLDVIDFDGEHALFAARVGI